MRTGVAVTTALALMSCARFEFTPVWDAQRRVPADTSCARDSDCAVYSQAPCCHTEYSVQRASLPPPARDELHCDVICPERSCHSQATAVCIKGQCAARIVDCARGTPEG